MKRRIIITCFACVFGCSVFAYPQAVPTASRPGALQIGVGFSDVITDYTPAHDKGPSFYATYDFTQHLGLEGAIHYASLIAPGDVGEDSYLIGPRYVIQHNRFEPYAKVLGGLGVINLQFDTSPHKRETYGAFALGAGLDVRISHKINVRALDFEYQLWPGFKPHSLSPVVITFGVAYAFH